jgi:hypothetical protein
VREAFAPGRLGAGRLAAASLAAIALALCLAATATALPGDPQIEDLSPPRFGATPVLGGGVDVTFTCPSYATGAGPGDAADYRVRFTRTGAGTGPGGLLERDNDPYEFLGEAKATPITGTSNCGAHLTLPWAPDPPALYLGPLTWQASRRCPGCPGGWETGPTDVLVLTPFAENADLSVPKHVYAGYPTRFAFTTTSDFSGAEVVLQWFGRRGWTDVERAPFVPGLESVFYAKLPAGPRSVRIALIGRLWTQGLPLRRVRVLPPTGPRLTGPEDDGEYRGGRGIDLVELEVARGGRRIFGFEASMPYSCGGAPPRAPTLTSARLSGVRIAPDGSVVGRADNNFESPSVATLEGRLRQGRFAGTASIAFGDCIGTRSFIARLRR